MNLTEYYLEILNYFHINNIVCANSEIETDSELDSIVFITFYILFKDLEITPDRFIDFDIEFQRFLIKVEEKFKVLNNEYIVTLSPLNLKED